MRYFVDAKSPSGTTVVFKPMDRAHVEADVPSLLETDHSVRIYKMVPVSFERRTTIVLDEIEGDGK